MTDPLDPFSEVVDKDRKFNPEWYSWLREIDRRIAAIEGSGGGGRGEFRVSLASDQVAGSTGAFNQILFDTEAFDEDAWFNVSNSRYVPQVAGYYIIGLGVTGFYDTVGDMVQAAIYKNGSAEFYGGWSNPSTSRSYSNVVGVLEMDGVTDYVEGWGYMPSSVVDKTFESAYCFMWGFRI